MNKIIRAFQSCLVLYGTFSKKIDKQNVSCNVCGKIYKTSGNTTNLSTHLKNKHHAFLQLKNKKKNSMSSEVNITPRTRTSSPVSSTNSTITNTNRPAEIENNFMELSEIAIYDDTDVSILFVQDQT